MKNLYIIDWIGNISLVNALLDRGANIHAEDNFQRTPLHKACIKGHMELAMALLDRDADIC